MGEALEPGARCVISIESACGLGVEYDFAMVGTRVRVSAGAGCVGLMAQWIRRLSTEQEIPGSNPGRIGGRVSLSVAEWPSGLRR